MMLVFYILYNYVSFLQTKFSDREGHEARRVGLEAVPLDRQIKGGHGERQACLKRRPAPMHHLLHMADERQHREHRLHQHAALPLAALTHFEIARIALRGMEAGIAQDNHPPINLLNQPLNLYSALCTEGSVRSELSSTFTVYQPHYPVCAAASTGIGSPGLALNHVGGTRGATRWTLSSTIDANLTS